MIKGSWWLFGLVSVFLSESVFGESLYAISTFPNLQNESKVETFPTRVFEITDSDGIKLARNVNTAQEGTVWADMSPDATHLVTLSRDIGFTRLRYQEISGGKSGGHFDLAIDGYRCGISFYWSENKGVGIISSVCPGSDDNSVFVAKLHRIDLLSGEVLEMPPKELPRIRFTAPSIELASYQNPTRRVVLQDETIALVFDGQTIPIAGVTPSPQVEECVSKGGQLTLTSMTSSHIVVVCPYQGTDFQPEGSRSLNGWKSLIAVFAKNGENWNHHTIDHYAIPRIFGAWLVIRQPQSLQIEELPKGTGHSSRMTPMFPAPETRFRSVSDFSGNYVIWNLQNNSIRMLTIDSWDSKVLSIENNILYLQAESSLLSYKLGDTEFGEPETVLESHLVPGFQFLSIKRLER